MPVPEYRYRGAGTGKCKHPLFCPLIFHHFTPYAQVCIGCALGGPASLICAVISADLGRNDKISGNKKALATISGIIDGTGSLGAALGQFVVGNTRFSL